MQINQFTIISRIEMFAPVSVATAFQGICLGADVDNTFLRSAGFGRVSDISDYAVDPKTQALASIPPAYNNQTHLWDVFSITPIPVATAAVAKCDSVDALLASKIGAGAHWSNILFQIDAASQTKFAGAGAFAIGVVNNVPGSLPWPANFFWIAADNSHVPMTAEQCFIFTQTMGQAITALILAARLIKDACLVAPDLATLNAIDITKNWPTV